MSIESPMDLSLIEKLEALKMEEVIDGVRHAPQQTFNMAVQKCINAAKKHTDAQGDVVERMYQAVRDEHILSPPTKEYWFAMITKMLAAMEKLPNGNKSPENNENQQNVTDRYSFVDRVTIAVKRAISECSVGIIATASAYEHIAKEAIAAMNYGGGLGVYPDCGSEIIEVCSGLEKLARGDEAGKCNKANYESKPEPVSSDPVSLERCAKAIAEHEHKFGTGMDSPEESWANWHSVYESMAQAVLDAAGVKYIE